MSQHQHSENTVAPSYKTRGIRGVDDHDFNKDPAAQEVASQHQHFENTVNSFIYQVFHAYLQQNHIFRDETSVI
jgi:hypothetical protein